MSDTERLKELLIERSVKTGTFILASGKSSTYYIDARLTTMSPEGMAVIGRLGLDRLKAEKWRPDSVGGLTLGADPVAYAISHTSASTSRPLRAFTVRKEAKTHGTAKRVEGPFATGDRVAVVEDVITTGKSALDAAAAVEEAGGHIVGILAVVDRLEGGRQALEQRGYRVISLTTIEELGISS
ncbi:MAG: orotate phosphoribosyltransferase [Gemmatimonadaceae bacterium]